MTKVRFMGNEYLIVGSLAGGGAVATAEQYANGLCSFAHLYPGGEIKRFGKVIGSRDDLEVVAEVEPPEPADDAMQNVLVHRSWRGVG
jgi:hypothetical protein